MLLQIAVSFSEFLHEFHVFFSLFVVISAGDLFSPYGHSLVLANLKQLGHFTLAIIVQAVDLAAQRLALCVPPCVVKRPRCVFWHA